MTGKSFSDFDSENKEDLLSLLYCIDLPGESFKLYKQALMASQKVFSAKLIAVNDYLSHINQFAIEREKKPDEEVENEESKKIGAIAMSLIYNGVDSHYVMEEMEIEDLRLFVDGASQKLKEKIENDRLWAFYNVLPHVSGIKSPQDLITFPWEEEEQRKKAEKNIEENEEIFKGIMNSKNIVK